MSKKIRWRVVYSRETLLNYLIYIFNIPISSLYSSPFPLLCTVYARHMTKHTVIDGIWLFFNLRKLQTHALSRMWMLNLPNAHTQI